VDRQIATWPNALAYLRLVSMAARTIYVYRANIGVNLLAMVVQLYLLKVVWSAVYAGRSTIAGVGLDELLQYLVLSNIQVWLLSPSLPAFVQDRVRTGQIAIDLVRPVAFRGQLIAQQAGTTVGMLPFVLLALPLAVGMGGLRLPSSLVMACLYAISLSLGFLIVTQIGLLLGLLAFWTLETTGFLALYRFVVQFFGGALVPLWFLPPPLRGVAELLPFQFQAFVPASIYLDRLGGDELLHALALQVLWVVGLFVLSRLVWQWAITRAVINGG